MAMDILDWAKQNPDKCEVVTKNGSNIVIVTKQITLTENILKASTPTEVIFLDKVIVQGEVCMDGNIKLVIPTLTGEENKSVLRIINSDGANGTPGTSGSNGNPPGDGTNGSRGEDAAPVEMTVGNVVGCYVIINGRGGNGGPGGPPGIGGDDEGIANAGLGGGGGNGANVKVNIIQGGNVYAYASVTSKKEQIKKYLQSLSQDKNKAITKAQEWLTHHEQRADRAIQDMQHQIAQVQASVNSRCVELDNHLSDFIKEVEKEQIDLNGQIQVIRDQAQTARHNVEVWRQKMLAEYPHLAGQIHAEADKHLREIDAHLQAQEAAYNQATNRRNEAKKNAQQQIATAKQEIQNEVKDPLAKGHQLIQEFQNRKQNFCSKKQHLASKAQELEQEIAQKMDELEQQYNKDITRVNQKLMEKIIEAREEKILSLKFKLLMVAMDKDINEEQKNAQLSLYQAQIKIHQEMILRMRSMLEHPEEQWRDDPQFQKEVEEFLTQSHRIFVHNHGGFPGLPGWGRNTMDMPLEDQMEQPGKDGTLEIKVITVEEMEALLKDKTGKDVDIKAPEEDQDLF